MAAGAIEPRRLALRYMPPGIIVEYARSPPVSGTSQTSRRQLYHHEIDLQDLLVTHSSKRLNIDAIVEQLIATHDRVLGDRKVSTHQVPFVQAAWLIWLSAVRLMVVELS